MHCFHQAVELIKRHHHSVICIPTSYNCVVCVIDDQLMEQALKASGLTTKKEVVEQGLRLLVRQNKQQAIRKLRGRLKWEGDLDEMRGRK